MNNYKTETAKQQKPILLNGQRMTWAELSALFVIRKAKLLATS